MGRPIREIAGPQLILKKNVYQAFVTEIHDWRHLPDAIKCVREERECRRMESFPWALRLRKEGSSGNPESFIEECEDDQEHGVGVRLLHLLQKWDVTSVLLVVGRQDRSLSGRLIGVEAFHVVIEAAKLALEDYYTSTVGSVKTNNVFTPDKSPKQAKTINGKPIEAHPAVCLMTGQQIPMIPQQPRYIPKLIKKQVVEPARRKPRKIKKYDNLALASPRTKPTIKTTVQADQEETGNQAKEHSISPRVHPRPQMDLSLPFNEKEVEQEEPKDKPMIVDRGRMLTPLEVKKQNS